MIESNRFMEMSDNWAILTGGMLNYDGSIKSSWESRRFRLLVRPTFA